MDHQITTESQSLQAASFASQRVLLLLWQIAADQSMRLNLLMRMTDIPPEHSNGRFLQKSAWLLLMVEYELEKTPDLITFSDPAFYEIIRTIVHSDPN